jgi:hypothetical protein
MQSAGEILDSSDDRQVVAAKASGKTQLVLKIRRFNPRSRGGTSSPCRWSPPIVSWTRCTR